MHAASGLKCGRLIVEESMNNRISNDESRIGNGNFNQTEL